MLQTPELFPAILAATLAVVMTTFLFCCWRRKGSKTDSPEKSGQPNSNATPQNGSVKENGEQSTTDVEFSAVQRETEILRPYRKPPPPKNRGRQSRAGRAMTRSTEHLDVFGEINEGDEEESALDTSTDSKVKIVLTDHSDNADVSDDLSIKFRDKAGKENDTRDARSSMLADIEQTLATLHRQSAEAKLGDDSLTPVETIKSVRDDKEESKLEGEIDDGTETDESKKVKAETLEESAETPARQNNLEIKESATSEESQSTTNEGQVMETKLENTVSSTKERTLNTMNSQSPPSSQKPKIAPKVSPKPSRAALAKAGIPVPLSESVKPAEVVPKESDSQISDKTDSQPQTVSSSAEPVVPEDEQTSETSKDGPHQTVEAGSTEDTSPEKETDSAAKDETTEKAKPPQKDGEAFLTTEQSAHIISDDPGDNTKDTVDPSDQQAAVNESNTQLSEIDRTSPDESREAEAPLEQSGTSDEQKNIDQRSKESTSENSKNTCDQTVPGVTDTLLSTAPKKKSETDQGSSKDIPDETSQQDSATSVTEPSPSRLDQMSEKVSANPDSTSQTSPESPKVTSKPVSPGPISQSASHETASQAASLETTSEDTCPDSATQPASQETTPQATSPDTTSQDASPDKTSHPASPDITSQPLSPKTPESPVSPEAPESPVSPPQSPAPQTEVRRDSEDGGAKGKNSRIPVRAGSKSRSSPPKSTSAENDE